MLEGAKQELAARPGRNIGRSFRRVGWLGFWVQIVLAAIPIGTFAIVFGVVRGFSLPGSRFDALGWFSLSSLLVLAFTTAWSWHYRRVGARIDGDDDVPDADSLIRTVWIGMGASALGILASLVVLVAEIVFLLIVFLEVPQGGAPVFQTLDGSGPAWVSAVDMLSLLALILTASAEIVTLLLALWLLYRVSALRPSAARPVEALFPKRALAET